MSNPYPLHSKEALRFQLGLVALPSLAMQAAPRQRPSQMSREQVLAEMRRRGQSVAGWARDQGYSLASVYALLYGNNKGHRGTSHEIAVRLGMKDGVIDAR